MTPRLRAILGYIALVVIPVAGILWILAAGGTLPPPVGVAEADPRSTLSESQVMLRLPVFLTQIIVIVVAARLMGAALHRIGQPRVVGEMLAGLMLGPSLLGVVAPDTYAWLFPPGTVRFLSALTQLGLVLFLFLIGLETDLRALIARGRETLLLSHAGIAMPMLLGAAAALVLYEDYSTAGTAFAPFALFLACAMSITAFPVLARILAERRLTKTRLGTLAIACAATADVSAWVVLALVIALVRGGTADAAQAMWRIPVSIGVYLAVMVVVVRPALEHLFRRRQTATRPAGAEQNRLSVLLMVVLLSSVAAEMIGVHALFGAFVAGAIAPRHEGLHAEVRVRLEDMLAVLLLPLFFAYAGVRTNIGTLSTGADWAVCGAVVLIATAGKVGGSLLAARATSLPWRDAGALGILMNTRGLMELVLLAIGLQIGIITPKLFTMLVIMALVTTAMTAPLLRVVLRPEPA